MSCCGKGVDGSVRKVLVGEDLDHCRKGSIGDRGDEDSGDDCLHTAVVAGHLLLVLGGADGDGEKRDGGKE